MNKKKPLETKLQSKIMNYIRSKYSGSVVFKLEKASVNGVPDVYASIPGYGSIWIEMKRDKTQHARPDQVAMIARLNAADTKAIVVHDWEEWMELNNEIKDKIGSVL